MKNVKIELKWAFIFTLAGLIWMVMERLVGLHDQYIDYHMYLTNLFAIPAITIMYFALKDKKINYYHGDITYGEGMLSGITLSFFISVLSPLSQWITSYVITPHYFTNVIKRSVELGYYTSEIEATTYFNFSNYAKQGAIGALIMGIITTAIAMFFLYTRQKNPLKK